MLLGIDDPTASGPPADWRDAGLLADFPADETTGVAFDLPDGRRLAVVVVQRVGRFYALHDRCPHRGAPFSELGLIDEGGNLLCGWHYWAFRLEDGAHTEVEGITVCTFPTRVTGDRLEIDINRPPR